MRKSIATILMTFLGLALLGYTATRTLDLVELTLPPESRIVGYLALAALDGGLIIWLLVFMYGARGAWQRAISLMMIIVSLVGIAIAVIADTFINAGARGALAKADSGTIAAAIWLISIIIVLNVAAAVAMHITDPDHLKAQAEEEARNKIEAMAIKQIAANADNLAAELAPSIGEAWVQSMRSQYLDPISEPKQLPGGNRTNFFSRAAKPVQMDTDPNESGRS